jgi:hypothetical protein
LIQSNFANYLRTSLFKINTYKHMKSILCLFIILISVKEISAQANQQLSNLSDTVAINRSLVPGSVYSLLDLGNSENAWRSIYMGSSDVDSISNNIMYYTGNIFMHNNGGATTGNSEGLYVGEFAGNQASFDNNGCVGIGFSALKSMDVGNHNTGLGWRSLLNLNGVTGNQGEKNTMVGSKSGESISTGSENTGIGHNVFYKGSDGTSVTGNKNTGIGGGFILKTLTSGSNNIVIGYGSGTAITTGSDNIIIGYTQESNLTSSGLNIGGTIYGDLANDKISIGNSGTISNSIFNVGTSDQFQVNSTGKIPQYGGSTPTNGQLLIGDGTDMELATLTEGSAIDVTNAAASITIALDINELPTETQADVDEDFFPLYDASESANNKINLEAMLAAYVTAYRRNRFDYYNEFINGIGTSAGGNDIVSVNSDGGGSISAAPTTATNVVGLIRSSTGNTDATGRTSCSTGASALALGGGTWTYELRINALPVLSNGSEDASPEIYQVLVGFFDVNTIQNQTDGIYFLYDSAGVTSGSEAGGSAYWQTVTSSNSNRNFVTTTTAVSTGVTTLKIVVNADATQVDFYLNDNATPVATHTNAATIPDGANRACGFGWMLMKSTGTANRAMDIDYLSAQCDYTTAK